MSVLITREYRKCIDCGYEYEWHYELNEQGNTKNNNKIITRGDVDFMEKAVTSGKSEDELRKFVTYLYMCPKCMILNK